MEFLEFFFKQGGSNLNAGFGPDTSPKLSYSGDWSNPSGHTWRFTVSSGNPQADGVLVGDFLSVFQPSAERSQFVGIVTARTSTYIETDAYYRLVGPPPAAGSGYLCRINGAWDTIETTGWPFSAFYGPSATTAAVYAGSKRFRFNVQSGRAYYANQGYALGTGDCLFFVIQGFTNTPGDGGRAVVYGPDSGNPVTLFNPGRGMVVDIDIMRNGAQSSSDWVGIQVPRGLAYRCRVMNSRGVAFRGTCVLCIADGVTTQSHVRGAFNRATAVMCIAQNCGADTPAFNLTTAIGCIARNNHHSGFRGEGVCVMCDSYNNGSHGYEDNGVGHEMGMWLISCNALKNAGYGFGGYFSTAAKCALGCGFGAGAEANTSGAIDNGAYGDETAFWYPSGHTPWLPDDPLFRAIHPHARQRVLEAAWFRRTIPAGSTPFSRIQDGIADTSTVHAGLVSLRHDGDGNMQISEFYHPATPGQTNQLSIWTRINSYGNATKPRVIVRDWDGNTLASATMSGGEDQWVQLAVEFTPPSNQHSVQVLLVSEAQQGGKAWFDD